MFKEHADKGVLLRATKNADFLLRKSAFFITLKRCHYMALGGVGMGFTQAAVPQSGTVERLCLKLPVVSLVE